MRLIDADALIKTLNKEKIEFNADANYIILNAPTIDAEPIKHGRWIQDRLVSLSGGTYGVRRCSYCGRYYQDYGYGWKYCPNCGARMEAENETYR